MLSYLWGYICPFYRTIYFTFLHPICKWLLRLWTGHCELLRISYSEIQGTGRTKQIESCLRHSKKQDLKCLLADNNVDINKAVEKIMSIKSIRPQEHKQFSEILRTCLTQICGYRQLIAEVEAARRTPYSCENTQHENMLMELWTKLMPEARLEKRVCRQWEEIGFQGTDPMTDFRGMGLLGLHNLLYFVREHPETARQLLSHSNHPKYGYSFAIVGINLTHLTLHLLHSGALKTHFYNVVNGRPRMEDFHQVYSYLFQEFDKFWFAEKPRDIMEFNRIKDKFQKKLVLMLKDKSTTLCHTDRYRPISL